MTSPTASSATWIPERFTLRLSLGFVLKGAADFNNGETTDFSTVGVKVVDDTTLELTFIDPALITRRSPACGSPARSPSGLSKAIAMAP